VKLSIILLAGLLSCCSAGPDRQLPVAHPDQEDKIDLASRLREKAAQARRFCEANAYNTEFCMLIDMNIHSGLERFFVYDLIREQVIDQGLTSHGICDYQPPHRSTPARPLFSNRKNSHCTSEGMYRIGKRDYSSWGINIKYVLHGLETSNNNAEERIVVLHSWEQVPDEATYPKGIVYSWGCPAVSDNFMKRLDDRLRTSIQPVLL